MSRFFLSPYARRDLAELKTYLLSLPAGPANRIGAAVQNTFRSIADNPYLGVGQSELTRTAGVEVRSRVSHPYRIFYIVGSSAPEIIGVLHTARDMPSIMAKRLQ